MFEKILTSIRVQIMGNNSCILFCLGYITFKVLCPVLSIVIKMDLEQLEESEGTGNPSPVRKVYLFAYEIVHCLKSNGF